MLRPFDQPCSMVPSSVPSAVCINLQNGAKYLYTFVLCKANLTEGRAAELADSLPILQSSDQSFETDADSQMQDSDSHQPSLSQLASNSDPDESRLEARELSKYILAKSYFDCREFDQCAAVFLPPASYATSRAAGAATAQGQSSSRFINGKLRATSTRSSINTKRLSNDLPLLSQKSLFLALYAKYMSGEKRRTEESEMVLGPQDSGSTINKELVTISRLLNGWFEDRAAKGLEGHNQGWLEYLYGTVLAKSKADDDAQEWLIKSIHLAPFNWGAWLELGALIENLENLQQLLSQLPQNVMTMVFHLFTNQELGHSTDYVHQSCSDLEQVFPRSPFIKSQKALLYYHSRDFEEAETIFSEILEKSPHRIDGMDHYSNILFVMANRPKLAFLAQLAIATDKFRPETCCVVGNYYSLKSEHEKAVVYFRRALTLDRTFLAAWTLMGHEYVEMKNTHAAIESYRRAVDANRKDYRAWFGLGQTYEILEMHFYALFYLQRAASLRPSDPKMWQAIGQCYEKIDRPIQSIKAYKRALAARPYYETGTSSFGSGTSDEPLSGILDPEILYQIALMYEKLDQIAEAATYMELTLAQEEGPLNDDDEDGIANDGAIAGGTGVTNTTSRARMWIARFEFSKGNLQRAMELANELCHDGVEIEEAKALIRDLRARIESGSGARNLS